jgi:coenzyme PQQ biosynthesis protein PqqD
MDRSSYPVPHPQAAARVVDGTAVIVLADSGMVKILNPVGTRIWELVDGSRTVQQIADTIFQEFQSTRSQIEQDVMEFLHELEGMQAITIQPHPWTKSPPVS